MQVVVVGTSPPSGLNGILYISNKRQSTSLALFGDTQKLDAVVDRKLPDDLDSASIFSKVVWHKLSNSSRYELYLRCRMKLAADVVQTQTPQLMDLGLPTIKILDERGVLGTPDTRIWRPTDGSCRSVPNNIFGQATAVEMSAAKSNHDYNYKTDLEIWSENQ